MSACAECKESVRYGDEPTVTDATGLQFHSRCYARHLRAQLAAKDEALREAEVSLVAAQAQYANRWLSIGDRSSSPPAGVIAIIGLVDAALASIRRALNQETK